MPRFVLTLIFGAAGYGGLVLLVGTVRSLEALSPRLEAPRRGAARVGVLAVLTLEGLALLMGVVFVVHRLDLADFVLGR